MSDETNREQSPGPEDKGLKAGDRARWEAAGEGMIRAVEARGGIMVGLVAPAGWHWHPDGYFTTEDTGAPGVPIRLVDLHRAEAPRTPEERLSWIQRSVKRLHGIARDVAIAAEVLKTETIGPGAREQLLDYHGGDKGAMGDTVRGFRAEAGELGDSGKEAGKAIKTVVEAAAFIEESLAVVYQDVLMGQDRQETIDDVEGGRNKKTKKKREKEAPVPAEAPTGAGEPPKRIPWGALRAWRPDDSHIEGDDLLVFLAAWREGKDQVGLLVPFKLIDSEDGSVEVLIDFERRRCAADKVALVEQEAVKRDGTGTETVERVVLCTPELVDWTGCPGYTAPEQPQLGALTPAQRAEAERRGLTPEQIASVEAALRADPKVTQVQLSKITGIERSKLNRILNAGGEA